MINQFGFKLVVGVMFAGMLLDGDHSLGIRGPASLIADEVTADWNQNSTRPNVILIVSDDQGIGDFGVMGNTVFETPTIDSFTRDCGSMSTFYVSPVCSPTRASLMTGRYNQRTRCIDTWVGRSMMDPEEVTIAEVLSQSGYATGIFGKWHLGDCYPMRPQDQGFDEVLVHRGGGLAQPSEPRENRRRYTDPILFHNGLQVQTKGFCTDVYFDAAFAFIEKSNQAKQPFFVYLATNAPHGPFHDVPEKLRKDYDQKDLSPIMIHPPEKEKAMADQQDRLARIGSMVTNIDQNMKRLLDLLDHSGLTDNTMVLLMVDNGPNSRRFVGPLRGMKGEIHEGGIRSPLWIRWPAKIDAGRTSDQLSAHIDIMPTILDACDVELPQNVQIDGRSLLPLLIQDSVRWPQRNLVIQAHRGDELIRYHHFMIRDQRFKLLHASGFGKENFAGKPKFELYDLKNDPGERHDLATEDPQLVQRMIQSYDRWFDDVSTTRPDNFAPPRIHIGSPHERSTVLTRQDWRGGKWNRDAIGHWEIHVEQAGRYEIELLFEAAKMDEKAIVEVVPTVVQATAGPIRHQGPIRAGAESNRFEMKLGKGDVRFHAQLQTEDASKARGAYQVVIRRVESGH